MQPTNFTCIRCGAPLTPGSTRCANCGLDFGAPVPFGPTPPAYAPPGRKPTSTATILLIVAGVVIVIIGIPLAAAIGFLKSAANVKLNSVQTQMDMQSIGTALKEYEQDYDGHLPVYKDAATFKAALRSYVPNTTDRHDPFIDSTNNKPFATADGYSGLTPGMVVGPDQTVLLAQQPPYKGHRLVVYLDGHVGAADPVQTSP